MKGLMLKDWYVAIRNCRIHIAVIAVTAVIIAVADVGLSYMMFPVVFAGMIPVYVQSVEERWGWHAYAQTMSVPRRVIVSEKYVASLITLAGTLLLLMAAWTVRVLCFGGAWTGFGVSLALMLGVGLLFPSIVFPAMFRLGVEKGRVVTLVVFVLVWAAVFGCVSGVESEADVSAIESGLSAAVFAVTGGIAVIFAGSWLLSNKLYETREL